MEFSRLGNLATGPKQSTETSSSNDVSKNARQALASEPQGTSTEEAQTSPIPPVNQTAAPSGEEGSSLSPESGSGGGIDVLA
jgi:hypothetical protein